MTEEELLTKIDSVAENLGEFIEDGAVQVLVTWNGGGGNTKRYYTGCGNWYARQGMAHEFITMDEAQEHAKQISEAINKEE